MREFVVDVFAVLGRVPAGDVGEGEVAVVLANDCFSSERLIHHDRRGGDPLDVDPGLHLAVVAKMRLHDDDLGRRVPSAPAGELGVLAHPSDAHVVGEDAMRPRPEPALVVVEHAHTDQQVVERFVLVVDLGTLHAEDGAGAPDVLALVDVRELHEPTSSGPVARRHIAPAALVHREARDERARVRGEVLDLLEVLPVLQASFGPRLPSSRFLQVEVVLLRDLPQKRGLHGGDVLTGFADRLDVRRVLGRAQLLLRRCLAFRAAQEDEQKKEQELHRFWSLRMR